MNAAGLSRCSADGMKSGWFHTWSRRSVPTAVSMRRHSSAAFIDTLLDDQPDTDFDDEFAKLEQELRNNPELKREDGDGKDDGREDGTEL